MAADSHSHAAEAAAARPGPEVAKADPAQDVEGRIWLTVDSLLVSYAAPLSLPAGNAEEVSALSSPAASPQGAPGLLTSALGTHNPATPVPEEGSHRSRSTHSTQDDLPDLPASPGEVMSGLPTPASVAEAADMVMPSLDGHGPAALEHPPSYQSAGSRASTESESSGGDVGATYGRPAAMSGRDIFGRRLHMRRHTAGAVMVLVEEDSPTAAPCVQRKLTDVWAHHHTSLAKLKSQMGNLTAPPEDMLSLLARRVFTRQSTTMQRVTSAGMLSDLAGHSSYQTESSVHQQQLAHQLSLPPIRTRLAGPCSGSS
ncbi:hypothetical protein N2152v2_004805 [Parachlorella kessleri]